MKKVVIKFSALEDSKTRRKSFKAVAGMLGVETVSIDAKESKITVIGETDPVRVVSKLKKYGSPELVSVGPAKEEKKEEKKQESNEKKGSQNPITPRVVYQELYHAYPAYPANLPIKEDNYDTSCTIC